MIVSLFVSIHVSFDSIGLYDSIGLAGNILRISTGGVKQHNHDKNIQKALYLKENRGILITNFNRSGSCPVYCYV